MTMVCPRNRVRKSLANWYSSLHSIQSKGSQTDPVGGLAGLAAAREIHQGQFFTPEDVVRFMWHVTGAGRVGKDELLCLYDNSFGSGRMFQFADPKQHKLIGIEIDAECAGKVRDAAKLAGFEYQLEIGSMEDFRAAGCQAFHLGLINPPFSLHFDSPNVEPFATNSYGRYGPNSSALSHRYAVAQALACCRTVAAVMPVSFIAEAKTEEDFSSRLAAIYHLPRSAFNAEGADVQTAILVWNSKYRDYHDEDEKGRNPLLEVDVADISDLAAIEPLRLAMGSRWDYNSNHSALARVEATTGKSVITRPYTGSKNVRIAHQGRRLVLQFQCGAAQGRVMNAVFAEKLFPSRSKDFRLADNVDYQGQGKLDLENHLFQADPAGSLQKLQDEIAALGYKVEIDPAILRLVGRRVRRDAIRRAPLRHVVNMSDGGLSRWLAQQATVCGVCVKAFQVWERSWGDKDKIPVGAEVTLSRCENNEKSWSYTHCQRYGTMDTEKLMERFQFPDFTPAPNEWTVIHEGLAQQFPVDFARLKARALKLGLDRWCSWGYQFDDLIEVGLKNGGVIVGWEMGLGKARLALALCYLGEGKRNLVVVETHLIKEMLTEIKMLGLPVKDFQVIEKPGQLQSLRRINIIAYSRLKMAVDKNHPRITYAKRLRRRVHTMVADEAHLLRNLKTDQSQACFAVSAKVRYALSGTPIANYPRDVLPLIQWVAGDGTATQPFGRFHPHLTGKNVQTMTRAERGVDVFRDMFVTLEWVSNEFADDLRSGAKREIPKIKDLDGFRKLVEPVLKRRVMEEPEVAVNIRIPRPVKVTTNIEWDLDHLVYYVKTAREFVDWYKKAKENTWREVGLIAILAKIQAVQTACNFPQAGVGGQGPYVPKTSKQRLALERLQTWTGEGHKTIFLAHSPDVVEFMATQLKASGIESVVFHGGVTVAKRIEALDAKFRFGKVPVLLATKGVLQTGYNIHQADRVLLYDRSWTPKVEQQACARVLRPQQDKQVLIEFLHLAGSIDDYQAQMVAFKAESMKAGLDFGSDDPSREFTHLETILGRFVEEFEAKAGKRLDDLIHATRKAGSL